MGLSAIPFTAILTYYRIYGVGSFDEFKYLIRRMDDVFLKFESERIKRESAANTKSSSTATNPSSGADAGRVQTRTKRNRKATR